jgi:hypothetical protein
VNVDAGKRQLVGGESEGRQRSCTMARKCFYSFHYKPDNARASQVRNIGVIEGNQPASDNDWESITKGGDDAIKRWIASQLKGKTCAVVLVGSGTANRKWINYEIVKAWDDGLGVVGIPRLPENYWGERRMRPVHDSPSIFENDTAEKGYKLQYSAIHGRLRPVTAIWHSARQSNFVLFQRNIELGDTHDATRSVKLELINAASSW